MWIIKKEQIAKVIKTVNTGSRVSRVKYTDYQLVDYLRTIDQINRMGRYDSMLNGANIETFKVAKHLEELIIPAAITYSGADSDLDLLSRPDGEFEGCELVSSKWDEKKENYIPVKEHYKGKVLGAQEFNDITFALMGALKKQDLKLANAKECRTEKLLSSVVAVAAYDGEVTYDENEFWPYELNVQLKKSFVYNYSIFEMFIRKLTLAIVEVADGARNQ